MQGLAKGFGSRRPRAPSQPAGPPLPSEGTRLLCQPLSTVVTAARQEGGQGDSCWMAWGAACRGAEGELGNTLIRRRASLGTACLHIQGFRENGFWGERTSFPPSFSCPLSAGGGGVTEDLDRGPGIRGQRRPLLPTGSLVCTGSAKSPSSACPGKPYFQVRRPSRPGLISARPDCLQLGPSKGGVFPHWP